uniref:Otoancorin n=1 Tax=Oryzias melastigma TaxID=30732 RepID=A0A3B3BJP4_ORYME
FDCDAGGPEGGWSGKGKVCEVVLFCHLVDSVVLNAEQQEKLRQFKIKTRIDNEKYMRAHPEVEVLIIQYFCYFPLLDAFLHFFLSCFQTHRMLNCSHLSFMIQKIRNSSVSVKKNKL